MGFFFGLSPLQGGEIQHCWGCLALQEWDHRSDGLTGAADPVDERGPGDVRDLTMAFNAMRARIIAMLDEKDRMLGAIGHDLRTPLASLAGFIETLQGPARDDAAARERFLAIMRDQAARMSRLIDDLLSLSRIEMKRHLPVKTPVDLTNIVQTVEDQIAPLAEELGVSIELDLPQTPVFVAGEEDELLQVFSNLVENACKYGQSGGRVTVRVLQGEERGRPVIDGSVIDYGPGIAPEHVPRLTERFYRVDVANSRSKRGTGLGLSIVRNILLRHKGRLLVHSEVDKGSTFTARFPACDARIVEFEKRHNNQELEVS